MSLVIQFFLMRLIFYKNCILQGDSCRDCVGLMLTKFGLVLTRTGLMLISVDSCIKKRLILIEEFLQLIFMKKNTIANFIDEKILTLRYSN